jgi:hypothetical protein
MGADQDFQSFLREWTNDRILPTGDFLDPADQQYMAERRATELMQLAKESGFADRLMEIVNRYGGGASYVKHLMWEADFKATQSRAT